MSQLTDIEDKIDEACDVLRCLDMAFQDLGDQERGPLTTVLGIAMRQLVAVRGAVGFSGSRR
jgi:hypothetical protein